MDVIDWLFDKVYDLISPSIDNEVKKKDIEKTSPILEKKNDLDKQEARSISVPKEQLLVIGEKDNERQQISNIAFPAEKSSLNLTQEKGLIEQLVTNHTLESDNQPSVRNISVTNKNEIENCLYSFHESDNYRKELTIYCPKRNAVIYCHSVLIDKLSELTKFIISSLYHNFSIEEIQSLTLMGNITINEEIYYLRKGGLIEKNNLELTELGKEYGALLDEFKAISNGIPVVLNTFLDKFEETQANLFHKSEIGNANCLPEKYSLALTRNDNYANSLEIAKKLISKSMPFSYQIKMSLYTTVRIIDKKAAQFEKYYMKDFSRGTSETTTASFAIVFPIKQIIFKPLYIKLDKYRSILKDLTYIGNQAPECLSDVGNLIIKSYSEETTAENITLFINTFTGTIYKHLSYMKIDENKNDSLFFSGDNNTQIKVDPSIEHEIYLQEVESKQFYYTTYYSFSRLENSL